jgi:glycosyltransferase involved in cell wall biosynthesis
MGIVHVLEKNRLTTGSVVQMMEAAAGLAARGHRVTVVSRPGGDLEQACDEAIVGLFQLPLRHGLDVGSARRLRRLLILGGTDVVHVHKGRGHGIALLAATRLGRLPVVVVNRGVSFPLDRFNRWKYRHPRVRAVVCVAEAVREVVIRSAGVEPGRVVTVRSGTDVSRFDPDHVHGAAIRRELGMTSDHLVVGQVSVRDWKGWREVVDSVARLVPGWPNLRLVLIGCEPDPVRRVVEDQVATHGLADFVILTGFRSDMPEVLAACDIVVDASWAGTGITGTVREAMAMAKPVVATDCAGNSELVDADVGRVVPPRDVEALTAALAELLASDHLRVRLGRAGRRRVEAGFSTERRVVRLEGLYRRLVAGAMNTTTPRRSGA